MIEHLTDRAALAVTTTDPVGTVLAWMSGVAGIVIAAVALALLVLLIAAVISAVIDDNTTAGGKLLWVLFILWFPLFGAISWFVVGKKGYLNRILGIDKGKVRHTNPRSVGQHSDLRDSGPIPRPSVEHDPGAGQGPGTEYSPGSGHGSTAGHDSGGVRQYPTGPQQNPAGAHQYPTGPQQYPTGHM